MTPLEIAKNCLGHILLGLLVAILPTALYWWQFGLGWGLFTGWLVQAVAFFFVEVSDHRKKLGRDGSTWRGWPAIFNVVEWHPDSQRDAAAPAIGNGIVALVVYWVLS